jgi:hypothetical protein
MKELKDESKLLYALFQASALHDTLDDISVQNLYVREFKRLTNKYIKVLKNKTYRLINEAFETDEETFETMDRVVTYYSKQMASKMFELYLNTVKPMPLGLSLIRLVVCLKNTKGLSLLRPVFAM